MRHALVFGAGLHAVDAGKVDQGDLAAGMEFGFSHAMLHRDAWEVRDFLAETGEAVEQSRFAGIGWTDNCYHALLTGGWRGEDGYIRGTIVTVAHDVLLSQKKMPGRLAPQCDFGAVHLKYSRVAAGGCLGRCNSVPREEAQLHQAACLILVQINAFKNCGFAALELRKVGRARLGPSLETRLHCQNSIRFDSPRVNTFECIQCANELHLPPLSNYSIHHLGLEWSDISCPVSPNAIVALARCEG